MAKYPLYILLSLVSLLFFSSCKEHIIEYRDNFPPGKPIQNDQYHGDIVGRVLQYESGAVAYVSQVNIIDSVAIDQRDGSFIFQSVRLGNYDLTIRANNFRIYKRSNVIVPGGGIVYVGDIDLSTIPDLVADVYPKDKDEIVYDNRFARLSISILFTQPMDRKSVEEALTTDPPSTGIFYWGSYTYSPIYALYNSDADREFTPINPGATITTFSKITSLTYVLSRKDSYVDTTYTVTLSTSAHDTSGNHLRFPLVLKFKTIQAGYTIYGIQSDPVDGDIEVPPISYSGIHITFPRRMDPTSTEAALAITPDDSRIVLWPVENQMTIYLGGVYRAETKYTVTVDSTAKDLDGNSLGQRFSFSFWTSPVRVSSTSPTNGELFVKYQPNITMAFNTFIVKSTVQNSFSITPPVTGTFVYGYGTGYNDDAKNVVTFI
ncbi:MAG: Ig-like domain-containing protein, partial [Ignavibacteriae bacterium]|nr:Ig-like domain-containing protein [Ignavibacteriota bacterium]